jgi:dTDP-4-amino-4,6-dideoxygalactose transaminase
LFPDVDPESFPESEKMFERGMLIGLHQGLTDEDVDWVCQQLAEIAEQFSQ